jgi:hypothetical protein
MKLNQKLVVALLVMLIAAILCEAARRKRIPIQLKNHRHTNLSKLKNQKQMLYETQQTSPLNFVKLLFMRLVFTNGMLVKLDKESVSLLILLIIWILQSCFHVDPHCLKFHLSADYIENQVWLYRLHSESHSKNVGLMSEAPVTISNK